MSIRAIAPFFISTDRAGQRLEQLGEVRVVTDEDRPLRIAAVAQDRVHDARVKAARQPVLDRGRRAQPLGDDLGGSERPHLRRGQDDVGAERGPGEEPSEPFGLLLALARQRAIRVVAGPGLGIAGIGMAQQVQLGHVPGGYRLGGAASTSPGSRSATRASADERIDPLLDQDEDTSKDREPLLFGAFGRSGVLEVPVERPVDAGKDGTALLRLVAHGDDVVERLSEIRRHRLRPRPGRVDADLGENAEGQRVDALRFGPCTGDQEPVATRPAEAALRPSRSGPSCRYTRTARGSAAPRRRRPLEAPVSLTGSGPRPRRSRDRRRPRRYSSHGRRSVRGSGTR